MLGQMKRQLENSRCFRQGMEKDLEECAEARWLAKPVLDSRALPLDSASATLSRDDNQLKMCLLCICERSVTLLIKKSLIHKYPFFDLFSKLVKSFCNINKVFL